MTVPEAIRLARNLQAEADEGWPYGFERERVLRECLAAMAAIEAWLSRSSGNVAATHARDIVQQIFA